MAIVFSCPFCGQEHRSRLLALRRRYFDEVIPQLGDIAEVCPGTRNWFTLSHVDMRWTDEPEPGLALS
jgi:hypothetical protein